MTADRVAPLLKLARDASGASIGLAIRALPPGHLVEVPDDGPLFWIGEGAPTSEDMAWARAGFAVSGLWPLLLDSDGSPAGVEHLDYRLEEQTPGWHLDRGSEQDFPELDPESLLADAWLGEITENEENEYYEPHERVSGLAPAGTDWPGLAPAATWEGHPDQYANGMVEFLLANEWFRQSRMVLVPAVSSIDALIASRCVLRGLPAPEHTAGLVAMLSSWARRFGAQPIAMRPDTLFVSVAAPPTDRPQAAHVACEHFAFAPDNVNQNSDSFPEYVDGIIDANLWAFWWD